MFSRRAFLSNATAVPLAIATTAVSTAKARPNGAGLQSMTGGAKAISADERRMRIAKVQALMLQANMAALIVEPGSTLDYFTGIRWWRSERTTVAVIPAHGDVLIVTPAFEEPSVRETLQVGGDVRVWNEPESPFEKIALGLRERSVAAGTVAVESTTRFFIVDGLRIASNDAYRLVSADALVRACRLIKSPAELALMQIANDVTLAALRHVHAHIDRGMTAAEVSKLMDTATTALGGPPEFSMALLNEASAYPHGSRKPQTVRDGSIILMDCGCSVEGYQSDISRTWVFGEPTARQRKVWDTVKRGQEIALATAKIGTPVGQLGPGVPTAGAAAPHRPRDRLGRA
jgi:Xaa-Pro dipeptidase